MEIARCGLELTYVTDGVTTSRFACALRAGHKDQHLSGSISWPNLKLKRKWAVDEQDDPLWLVRPLLDAGFKKEHLRSLSEWIAFEAIAAEEQQRPFSFAEIDSHLSPELRLALRETVKRSKEQHRGDAP